MSDQPALAKPFCSLCLADEDEAKDCDCERDDSVEVAEETHDYD